MNPTPIRYSTPAEIDALIASGLKIVCMAHGFGSRPFVPLSEARQLARAHVNSTNLANADFARAMRERRQPAKLAALAAEIGRMSNHFSERLKKLET